MEKLRKANAVWQGGLEDGKGWVSSESGVLSDTPYNFAKRFGEEAGTNPEELVAAAHAACFAMASSAELGKVGITPEKIEAGCTIKFEMVEGAPTITLAKLTATVVVPAGSDEAKARQAVEAAKAGCPISRLLNAPMELELNIVQSGAAG